MMRGDELLLLGDYPVVPCGAIAKPPLAAPADDPVKDIVVPHLTHGIVGIARHERRTFDRLDAQPFRAQSVTDSRTLSLVADVVKGNHLRVMLARAAQVLRNPVEPERRAPHEAQDIVLLRAGEDVPPRNIPGAASREPVPKVRSPSDEQGNTSHCPTI